VTRPVRVVPLLLLLLLAGGCARLPKLIVLEDPLSASEHLDLGVAYERQGELDLAAREYEKALRKDGRLLRARVNLGNVFLAKRQYGDARREYLRALDIDGADPAATNNLAWAAILSGENLEGSLGRMDALLSDPARRTAPLLDTLGVLRAGLGKAESAEKAFIAAEEACDRDIAAGGGECTPEVRRDIVQHRAQLRGTIHPPAGGSPLVK
jgi:tetratricopeptide (TPR) repeat protein